MTCDRLEHQKLQSAKTACSERNKRLCIGAPLGRGGNRKGKSEYLFDWVREQGDTGLQLLCFSAATATMSSITMSAQLHDVLSLKVLEDLNVPALFT